MGGSIYSRRNIQSLAPYVPGSQPEDAAVLKLNANENPYPPSPVVLETLQAHISDQLRLYPPSRSPGLRNKVAKTYQVSENQVFCGNGSDEIISIIFRTFAEPDDEVQLVYPTYTFYQTAAEIHDIHYRVSETGTLFEVDLDSFLIRPSKLAFIANPNAHTGTLVTAQAIQEFLSHYKGLFVVDEAYIDFGSAKESAISLIQRFSNLLVLRTFSKSFSLCGIRVGYAFGDPELISAMDKTKDSYNVAYLNQVAAVSALEDYEYMQCNAQRIIKTRGWFCQAMRQMGFIVLPSAGNFLLVQHPQASARDLFEQLMKRNILVRFFDQSRLREYIRVSIGTDHQMEQVISALNDILILCG